MKTHMIRVPDEYEDEVNDMVKKIQKSFGVNIPKVRALKIILLKSKNTTYKLTEHELLKILGS